MAYKVVDSEVLDNGLHGIADKIREKSGTTEELVFPEGFENAVDSIVGSKEEEEKTLSVTKNGNYEVIPAEGKAMSKVNVDVNVAFDGEIGKPYIDTSKITYFSGFCSANRMNNLLDNLDTSNGENFVNIFQNCTELTTIPQLDTSKGKNFSQMFYGCSALQTIPQLDTSKGTNFGSTFRGCKKLQEIPQLDTSNGEDFSYMFYGCSALQTIPQLDTSKGTNFNSMFHSCFSAETIPQLDISNGTNFGYMFYDSEIVTVSLTTAKSDFKTNTFQDCTALKNITIGEGWAVSIYLNYSNNLTVESLHGMIENLADLTGKTAKTFQIGATNLAKIDAEHLAMLQNKNWNYS